MNHTVLTVSRLTGKSPSQAESYWRNAKNYARIQGVKGNWVVVLQHFQKMCGMDINPLVSSREIKPDPDRPWLPSGEFGAMSPEWVMVGDKKLPLIILL